MRDILIADDERVVRARLKDLFEREGYSVSLARTDGEAVAKFCEKRPDLVILDFKMPRRGGLAACAEIREIDKTVPVIFLSGIDCDSVEIRTLDSGADDFISKDASDETLLARVRRALSRSEQTGGAESGAKKLLVGNIVVDTSSREARIPGKGTIRMTGVDIALLRTLDSDRSRYFTVAEIASLMYGRSTNISPDTVRTHICRLKRKLGSAGELICSGRGDGYRLCP